MAYVPGANRDIFISYPIEAEEWAQHFEQDLRKELEQWLPANEVRTYLAKRDWQFAPSDEMLEQARQAAFFIATLVPGALSEEGLRFFQQEWEAFGASADRFGTVETRFVPVLIKPIDSRLVAQFFPLANEKAFWRPAEFYYSDKAGIPHTLLPTSRKAIYRKKITELAWLINQRLAQIKQQVTAGQGKGAAGQPAAKGPFSGMKVLLGERDDELRSEWDEVRQLLLNDGVELVSSAEYPPNDDQLKDQLKQELPRADLFVQLLNPLREASLWAKAEAGPDRENITSRAELIYGCALAYLKTATRPFAILQWRDPKITRDALKFWPEKLLDSAHAQAVGLQQFKRAVRAKLEDLRKPPPPSPSNRPFLFITADQPDLMLAKALSDAALDYADVDVMTETEQDRKEHFVEAMKLAAGVIILHGKAPVQFVNNWLSMYVREKAKLKRKSQFDALYRAPPRKESNEEPRIPTRDLRSLGSEELFTLEGIQQLLKDLDGAV
jgi:hypothetical protein